VEGVAMPVLHTAAVRDAAPRAAAGPFPLVVFSHGHAGIRWQSTFYTVALASHGYVVVAPDHTGDTLQDALRKQLDEVPVAFDHRLSDATFLIDNYTFLPRDDPFAGMVDPARVGVTGHSFGALTSLRAAAFDDRVKAIVPQAPPTADLAFAGKAPGYMPDIPVLVEAAHEDRTLTWTEHVEPTWNRLHSPRGLLDISHGGHFTFSDLCAFDLATIAGKVGFVDLQTVVDDGCGPTAPTAAVAEPIMNHYAIGFFNATLRGSTKSWALLDQAHAEALTPGVAVFTNDLGAH
jgi:predicted dienelactone hydrolase